MRTLAEALDQFLYHPATPDTAPKHHSVRTALVNIARELWDVIPDSPEKTLAYRKLQEAGMYANLAIALSVPADTTTADVARVLPSETTISASEAGPTDHIDVNPRANVELEILKNTHIKNGRCVGPVESDGAQYGLARAKCHHGLCAWETSYDPGTKSLTQLQYEHDEAKAQLAP